MKTTDVLIIGSGIAGATAALQLARNPSAGSSCSHVRPTRRVELVAMPRAASSVAAG